ncbi:hypothetical protein F4802DRAFT_580369 [Xylaria palmicola]|nr:hypothetical protein F4802DRAFT_580369 [Xylaria palmicola]
MDDMLPDRATLSVTPAGMPPAGITPNLINPESRSWQVELTIGVTIAPAILLVILRLYARIRLSRNVGIDDYFCILATASSITYNGLVLSLLDTLGNGALGPHIWNVSALKYRAYRWQGVIDSIFGRLSNTLIKVSLLTLYLRIFNPVPRLRWMIWIGLITVVGFFFAVFIGTLILCIPRPGENDRPDLPAFPRQPCQVGVPYLTSVGTVFSVITDFYILFIPIHMLPSLKLSRRRKAALGGVFLIGLIACLAGVSNLVIRFARYLPGRRYDITWNVIDTYITKISENNAGLICCCTPAVSAVVAGPMRRLAAFFSSWFRKPNEEAQGTRGYRDFPVTIGQKARNRGGAIPRTTLTGLRSLFGNTSGSENQDDPIALGTLPMHDGLRSSQRSLMNGSYTAHDYQSSREAISVVQPPSR